MKYLALATAPFGVFDDDYSTDECNLMISGSEAHNCLKPVEVIRLNDCDPCTDLAV